jgi:formylglycine-generating enzyme required for sulfatase activity
MLYWKSIALCFCIFFLASCKRDKSTQFKAIVQRKSLDTTILGLSFVKVPAGKFLYGIKNEIKDIDYDYYIMKYEVTNAQYYDYLKHQLVQNKIWVKDGKVYKNIAGIHHLPDSVYYIKFLNDAIQFKGDSFQLSKDFSDHPVISINWIGCMDYCKEKGLKLPNREEWEKAARGMQSFDFPWGNDIDSSYANYWNSGDPFEPGTNPVGYYNGEKHGLFQTKNALSLYGCYDMAGNAWEYLHEYIDCRGIGGAGGGFNYHTPAFLTIYNSNCFGLPLPQNIDRCDTSDGFRPVYIP